MSVIAWGPPRNTWRVFIYAPGVRLKSHSLTCRTAAREKIEELLFFQLPQFFFPFLPGLLVREPAKAQPAFAVADETQRSAAVSASLFVHRLHSRSKSHWRIGCPRWRLPSRRRRCCKYGQVRPCREPCCKRRASFLKTIRFIVNLK